MKKTISILIILVLMCGVCGCSGTLAVRPTDIEGGDCIPIGICLVALTEEEFNVTSDKLLQVDELLIPVKDGQKDFANITTSEGRQVYMCAYYIYTDDKNYARQSIVTNGLYGIDAKIETQLFYDEGTDFINNPDLATNPAKTVEIATLSCLGYAKETGGNYFRFYTVYERADGTLFIRSKDSETEYFGGKSISVHKILDSNVTWEGDQFATLKQFDMTITIETRPDDVNYEITWLDKDNNPIDAEAWDITDGEAPELVAPAEAVWILLHETGDGLDENTLYKLNSGEAKPFIIVGGEGRLYRIETIDITEP